MRINQYLAQTIGISRRAADKDIEAGLVRIGGKRAHLGDQVEGAAEVSYKGKVLVQKKAAPITIVLNKPVGYVTSRKRDETAAPTVMELLPPELHHLKPVGRLDKESDGLLILTDDGDAIYKSTHPKFQTAKEYLVNFEHPLSDREIVLWKKGLKLTDGIAKADKIERVGRKFHITLHQGKNRQIRRMAGKSGNKVLNLTRLSMGEIKLGNLEVGKWKKLESSKKKAII